MIDGSGFPIPENPDEIARRLTDLERSLAVEAARRSLTASAIGKGGLRVYDGGSIKIEGDGSLFLETGNLVLKAGSISGAMLEDQISTEFQSGSATGFPLTTTHADVVTVTVTPPPWAAKTVVSCQATALIPQAGWIRGVLNGTVQQDVATGERQSGLDNAHTKSVAWGGVVTTGLVVATLQARRTNGAFEAPGSKRADLQVTCLHFR